jgi:hemerythrin-like domain-containing protein
MLTATYTLVALSVEQVYIRKHVQALQKLLHSAFAHQNALAAGQVGAACDMVKRLYENCHWRKVDMFLVPAVRKASPAADRLLLDLEELGRAATDAVGVLVVRLGVKALDTYAGVAQFCAALEAFCSATLKRLEREEKELFPVARAVISGEAWFSIANEMLVNDAYEQDRRPSRQPVPPARRGRDADLGRSDEGARRHAASNAASRPANHPANQFATPLAH